MLDTQAHLLHSLPHHDLIRLVKNVSLPHVLEEGESGEHVHDLPETILLVKPLQYRSESENHTEEHDRVSPG